MDKIREVLKSKAKEPDRFFLSTGSTLLNLACSDRPNGGFLSGGYYYLVGDSSSGKTFLSLTCFAEAVLNKNFKNHRFIFDNAEDGALMDFAKFFGRTVAERVEPPRIVKGQSEPSVTIQDFYFNLDDAIEDGRPFIYVLDSMDALTSDQEIQKFKDKKRASRKIKTSDEEEKVTGTYGVEKAKQNSEGLRKVRAFLKRTNSLLIIISQTRDNIAKFSFDPKTRSGGRALTFYANCELWSSQAGHIKKGSGAQVRELGIYAKIRVKKNRIAGKDRTVEIPIYHSYGIDDIGSCVQYLINQKHWPASGKKGSFAAEEFDIQGTPEKIARYIDDNDMTADLKSIVHDVWTTFEESCILKRKKRYD